MRYDDCAAKKSRLKLLRVIVDARRFRLFVVGQDGGRDRHQVEKQATQSLLLNFDGVESLGEAVQLAADVAQGQHDQPGEEQAGINVACHVAKEHQGAHHKTDEASVGQQPI